MTKRIFRSMCGVAVSVIIITIALLIGIVYGYFSASETSHLKTYTAFVSRGIEISGKDFFNDLNTEKYRVTLISKDGKVLYDTHKDISQMENHMERQEIKDAIKKGFGYSKRKSQTFMKVYLYYAERLPDGEIVRVSIPQKTIFNILFDMAEPIIIVLLAVFVFSVVLSKKLTKSIITPLNNLNLDAPLENEGYDEISELLRRINTQQEQLKLQSQKIQRKKDELEAVIESMNEGLVILNSKNNIISINKSAEKLLAIDSANIGNNIFLICRNLPLEEILEKCKNGIRSNYIIDFATGTYQLNASPIMSNEKIVGIALLFFDVTEKEKTEQIRREFTANVSHELKTPLHSIAGYSELMANGIVKPDDYMAFSEKIHTEAKRMIQLIEDIIELSHLDEGATDMKQTEVDLFLLAQEVANSLSDKAKSSQVEINIKGEKAVFSGILPLVKGIVYNLCDNAIKYNKIGGKVDITVKNNVSNVILTVKDNGIGIAKEHHERIFERFYRVDKSHSKEVGGTGLGLSIVKHSAKIHNAKVEFDSDIGKGTEIKITFPKKSVIFS